MILIPIFKLKLSLLSFKTYYFRFVKFLPPFRLSKQFLLNWLFLDLTDIAVRYWTFSPCLDFTLMPNVKNRTEAKYSHFASVKTSVSDF